MMVKSNATDFFFKPWLSFCIRRLLGSTDHADPGCLLQNFMNIDRTTLILIFWFPLLSAGPQKQEHKVGHNYFSVQALKKLVVFFQSLK